MLNDFSTIRAIDIKDRDTAVTNSIKNKNGEVDKGKFWLILIVISGVALPILGPIILEILFTNWKFNSLPVHSTFEVAGAVFGLVLAIIILFSSQKIMTNRRMLIACALIAMAVFDICHSCVPAGVSFVWLHSLSVLAGGIFFILVWMPAKEITKNNQLSVVTMVFLVTTSIGILSAIYPQNLPLMIEKGQFTLTAVLMNLLGGSLTLIAALHFTVSYHKNKDSEYLLYLILCLLFGVAGITFQLSSIWDITWWFWHALRFGAYFLAFWLALFFYRQKEETYVRIQTDHANTIADGNYNLEISPQHERDELSKALQSMTQVLRNSQEKSQKQEWLEKGIMRLNNVMIGDLDIIELCNRVVTEVSTYLGAQVGTFYLLDNKNGERDTIKLTGSYAFNKRKNLSNKFKLGEGLIGQAALEKQKILIRNIPDDYMQITSTLVESSPQFICIAPIKLENRVKGVIEFGSLHEITDLQMDYLDQALNLIAINVETAENRTKLNSALQESQALSEELQAQQEELKTANQDLEDQTDRLKKSEQQLQSQQEELRVTNEELTEQTKQLIKSEENLKAQQEELQVTNEELEEKTAYLQRQKNEIEIKNAELVSIRKNLEEKARELEITSKYKSEFLANMSHELRTPLNSMLLLSQRLSQNKENTLTPNQLKSTKIIHDSGNDLLNLINDILDLSKIEAGKVILNINKIDLNDVAESIESNFKPQMDNKKLLFSCNIEKRLPKTINSDQQRLEQIIKNFMSNAIKFSDKGEIRINFHKPKKDVIFINNNLKNEHTIAISVTDSGIGIPESKQREIFEAFQQVDGSTSRKYGGTGLGLSISRELARLLGGEIQLKSNPGKGSTFTFYFPENLESSEQTTNIEQRFTESEIEHKKVEIRTKIEPHVDTEKKVNLQNINDDRGDIKETDRIILVVEDDINFAKTLYEICHEKRFKCIHAADGETGLKYAKEFPVDAIILDIKLPKLDGWGVLDALKEDSSTRHIPVHIMSVDEESVDAFKKGVIGYLTKPVLKENLDDAFSKIEDWLSKDLKDLLIVEDDKKLCQSIKQLIGNSDVKITNVYTGKDALKQIKTKKYDCMILDLSLPDLSGFDVLEQLDKLKNIPKPPVIIYTGKDLTREEEYELRKYADSIIIKGVKSDERLLDETALFLHRVVDHLPAKKKRMISKLYDKEQIFKGKKVLIVDDDMRNVFAISQVLEEREMQLLRAADGQKALNILEKEKNIDLVLMDIMMPVMDGYETMKAIRKQKRFWKLPILALTAKAMKQDREKCIAGGANDYLTKPVDLDRLLSMMRIWLYK